MNKQGLHWIATILTSIVMLLLAFQIRDSRIQIAELQQKVQTLETSQSDFEDDVITAFEAQQTEMDAFIEFAEQVTDIIINGR